MTDAIKIYDQLQFVHSTPQTNAAQIADEVRIESLPDQRLVCVGLNVRIARDAAIGQNVYAATATEDDRKIDPAIKPVQIKVKGLTVVCDTLTIGCRWWLPECDVRIFARRIVFQNDGCIDTSPQPWVRANAANAAGKTAGAKGEGGRTAGDITLFAGKVETPKGSRARRLIAKGSDGQGGGEGVRGADGRNSPGNRLGFKGVYTHEDKHTDTSVITTVKVKLDKHSDHTIIGIRRRWKVFEMNAGEGDWGTLEFPTSGVDAIAPGDSGNGGNGGKVYTNRDDLIAVSDAAAGKAGRLAPIARGGAAGQPMKAAYYDNTYYWKAHSIILSPIYWFAKDQYSHDNSGESKIEVKLNTTRAGQEKSAAPGSDGKTWEPELAKSNKTNLWLHPRIVPVVLDFIRRAYLGEQRAEARALLAAYEPAFQEGMPARARGTDWEPEDEAYFSSVGLEMATLNQRLAVGLDYFGNPAGYAPLLSLSSSFRQYQLELDSALEVLVFAGWLEAKHSANKVVNEASRVAANLLTKENSAISRAITEAEAKVKDIGERIRTIDDTQNELVGKIGVIRTKLINQAGAASAKVAQVKLAANLAAGLLQVVPFGQPILGGVASTAADATDLLDEDQDKVIEKLKTKVGKVVDDYKEAQKAAEKLVTDAKKEAKEFAKAEDKELTVAQLKALNAKTDPAWKTAGKGIGSALGHLKTAYDKGQVTRADIDSRLAKLAAADPEWLKLSAELARLADDKANLLGDIAAMVRVMGQQSAVIAGNSAAVGRLDANASSLAARMLGNSAAKAVEEMQRRAVMSLTEALYNLVRAFESSRLEPLTVDWSNASFLKDLNNIIDAKSMDTWDDDKVQARIKTLGIAFKATLRKVRGQLAGNARAINAGEFDRHFTLDAAIGPDRLADLNVGKWISIDTLDLGFVAPDKQHQLLASIKPLSLAFAEPADKLPQTGNLKVRMEIDDIGVLRKGTALYGIRLPAPVVYEFTYHFDTKAFSETQPSKAADDLLNIVLDDMEQKVKQRLAMPSAWGAMRINVSYSNMRGRTPPTITSVGLLAKIDGQSASHQERVLQVNSKDGFTSLSVSPVEPKPVLSGYFVFPSARTKVAIASADPGRPVRTWRITRNGREEERAGPKLDLAVDVDMTVEAEFA